MLKYFLLLMLSLSSWSLQAQITLDGTLGHQGTVLGPDYQIGAELGQQQGMNLFHSFHEFNLSKQESATFSGPTTIRNIISRVTGGEISHLDGLLRSAIPQADLYFINPAGIYMGPHASLDISGSFFASTAEVLRFEDGGSFNVRQPEESILSIAPITSFGFLTNSPRPLVVEKSQLSTPEQQAFSLIGGDLTMDQVQLHAPFGRLNLASTDGQGEIALKPEALNLTGPRGNINIHDSQINLNGEGGGAIYLQGGQISITESEITASTQGNAAGQGVTIQAEQFAMKGGHLFSGTKGVGQGGNINLKAEFVNLANTHLIADTIATGNGGTVEINAQQVKLEAGGTISASTLGEGQAGNVILTVADTLLITGEDNKAFPSRILAETRATSDGGSIKINAQHIKLEAGGTISATTFGEGQAGDLILTIGNTLLITGERSNALPSRITAQVNPQATGKGGRIEINAQHVKLKAGGEISATTFGEGQAGNVILTVTDTLLITGEDSKAFPSRILAQAEVTGDGSSIKINAQHIKLEAGGTISASTLGEGQAGDLILTVADTLLITGERSNALPSRITAQVNPQATGDGGSIKINAQQVELEAGGEISVSTFGEGQAGNLILTVADTLLITGEDSNAWPSRILAETRTTGNGGIIEINAQHVKLEAGGEISVSTSGKGQASNLILTAADTLLITGEKSSVLPSRITAQVNSQATGKGGRIEINAQHIKLEAGGEISATTFGKGQAGDLILTIADTLLITGEDSKTFPSRILAQAKATGNGSIIEINAQHVKLEAGGTISASTLGEGQAGDLILTVADTLLITGERSNALSSRITAQVNPQATGNGGRIKINAQQVELEAGGEISVSTFGEGQAGNLILTVADTLLITGEDSNARPSRILAETGTTGNGGIIKINAQHVKLKASGTISATTLGKGQGGDLELTTDSLLITQGTISAGSRNNGGLAGSIIITAHDNIRLQNQGNISTKTEGASGGDISITTAGLLYLTNSEITTSVQAKQGGGGDITLKPLFIILDGGRILAQAIEGAGGNMDIETNNIYVFLSNTFPQVKHQERLDNAINASSQLGVSGIITIDSPDINVGANLLVLPSIQADASSQLKKCIATALSERNHFYVKRLPSNTKPLNDLKPSRLLLAQPETHQSSLDQSPLKLAWLVGCQHDKSQVPTTPF